MTTFNVDIAEQGAQIWKDIHTKAFEAITAEKKKEFYQYIKELQEKFTCLECKNHFEEYLKNTPPNRYSKKRDKNGRDIGCFYWSWEFHDKVNKRLKKKRWSYNETYKYYKKMLTGNKKAEIETPSVKECTLTEEEKFFSVLELLRSYEQGKITARRLEELK